MGLMGLFHFPPHWCRSFFLGPSHIHPCHLTRVPCHSPPPPRSPCIHPRSPSTNPLNSFHSSSEWSPFLLGPLPFTPWNPSDHPGPSQLPFAHWTIPFAHGPLPFSLWSPFKYHMNPPFQLVNPFHSSSLLFHSLFGLFHSSLQLLPSL